MTKTIVALYDHRSEAETALRDLQAAGFESGSIDVLSHADLTGGSPSAIDTTANSTTDTMAAGTATAVPPIGMVEGMARPGLASGYVAGGIGSGLGGSTGAGGIRTRLTGWGVPDHDAQIYAEGVRRGGSLLRLRLDEEDVDRAMDVLERGNIVDVEERGAAYRETGWAGFDETAGYYDEEKAEEERMRYSPGRKPIGEGLTGAATAMRDVNTEGLRTGSSEREEQIPLVEEQVNIGKRSVERGGVRIRSYVIETPVEEQVRLRDETVTVERRPGDLGESGTTVPADAFRERTIEVTETDEEAVVNKTAHVRETVVVRKDVEERAETVRDTVRRTEVEIDDTRDKATDRRTDLDR